jgi:N-acetylmuramoyl-L-alanine amidase
VKITNTAWKWAYGLSRRSGNPTHLVLHHAAAKTLSPAAVHAAHLRNGWSGIGYHFYVRKSGAIYRGRPIWACGAHAPGYNAVGIGICAEGNYDTETNMPLKQEQALQWLVDRLRKRYPAVKVIRHRDVTATACPGRNYPTARIKAGLTTGKVVRLKVPTTKKGAFWTKVRAWMELTS